jgi:hypothetical protein
VLPRNDELLAAGGNDAAGPRGQARGWIEVGGLLIQADTAKTSFQSPQFSGEIGIGVELSFDLLVFRAL